MGRMLIAMTVLLAACTGSAVEEPSSEVDEPTIETTTLATAPLETTVPVANTTTTAATVPVEDTTTTAPPTEADLGTRGKPIPSGDAAVVGDYEVMVIGFTPDATDVVLDFNEFNDPPPDGSVYTLIRLEFTYVGDESGEPWLDVSWAGVGDSSVSSEVGDCFSYPDDLFELGELFPGGTADGNICLTVVEDDVDSLLLILEETFSVDETRVFFDLQSP